jgi:hypothetical protein
MFEIKVIYNDNSERVLQFPESIRVVTSHRYGQLLSCGDIKDYQIV